MTPNRASDAGPQTVRECRSCDSGKWTSLGYCKWCEDPLCSECQSGEVDGNRWCKEHKERFEEAREWAKLEALHENAEELKVAAVAVLSQMLLAGWGVSTDSVRRKAAERFMAVMTKVLEYD